MSGIVGLINLNGEPIDPQLLRKMTDSLAFRGPDAQHIWNGGHVGFGHTLLRTTFEAEHEHQPFTLDGKVWIVADARIDAQKDLVRELTAKGRVPPNEATDVELILHAYHAWGEQCVEHLLGDFAFGISDGPQHRLFCARDQMGIKPFYYAHVGSVVVFSNTLDCIRLHPIVSDRLNDLAIADFLLMQGNQDPTTTTFADVRRLQAAHRANWTRSGLNLSRYWTLPIDEPIFYRKSGDYLDRFKELLRESVTDRLRTRPIGITMSGGLDSPTLAATTHDLLCARYGTAEVKAFTHVAPYGPDERYYAEAVAKHLGIPIQFQFQESGVSEWNREGQRVFTPEPVIAPWDVKVMRNQIGEMAKYSRVFFFGEGPDNALRFEWRPYFRYLIGERRFGPLLTAVLSVAAHGPVPFWGRITRRIGELRFSDPIQHECYLKPELHLRLKCGARFERFLHLSSSHPIRPEGYASMLIPLWQAMFEMLDAGWTTIPMEFRHPFVDVRMVRYLLAVPPLPWCRSKYLLRRAMRGVLPRICLRRPKTGIPIPLVVKRLTEQGNFPFVPVPELCDYISDSYIKLAATAKIGELENDLRVRGLNCWFQNSWRNFTKN